MSTVLSLFVGITIFLHYVNDSSCERNRIELSQMLVLTENWRKMLAISKNFVPILTDFTSRIRFLFGILWG